MAQSDFYARVLAIVSDIAPLRDAVIGPESSLRGDLGYDSLSLLELAVALEDEFDLCGSAEMDTEVAETVGDVEQIVIEKLQLDRA
jgi:acyl carrier protein